MGPCMIDALVDAVVDAGRGADAGDVVDDDHSNGAGAGTLFLSANVIKLNANWTQLGPKTFDLSQTSCKLDSNSSHRPI